MKHLFTFIAILFCFTLSAQINKGQWLVGGHIAAMYTQATTSSGSEIYTRKQGSTQLDGGYFILNRFALGIRGQYSVGKEALDLPYARISTMNYVLGPYARFYILPATSRFNIFVDGSYSAGNAERNLTYGNWYSPVTIKDKTQNYTFNIAPVVFLNQHISLEFLLQYTRTKYKSSDYNEDNFLVGVGLQAHLGKGK
jgi:hypothetical protein